MSAYDDYVASLVSLAQIDDRLDSEIDGLTRQHQAAVAKLEAASAEPDRRRTEAQKAASDTLDAARSTLAVVGLESGLPRKVRPVVPTTETPRSSLNAMNRAFEALRASVSALQQRTKQEQLERQRAAQAAAAAEAEAAARAAAQAKAEAEALAARKRRQHQVMAAVAMLAIVCVVLLIIAVA